MRPKYQVALMAILLIIGSQVFNSCEYTYDPMVKKGPPASSPSHPWTSFQVQSWDNKPTMDGLMEITRIQVEDMTLIVIESRRGGLAIFNYSKDSAQMGVLRERLTDY